jgi:CRP/FNR family transcriptional regulator
MEQNLSKRTSFLKKINLFSKLSEENLKTLATKFHSRKYKKKEIIFHQGDDSHVLYVIMKGKVRIFSISPAGNETSYRIFTPHDVIGEFAAIDGRPRSTTAQAMEDCILLEIEHRQFKQSIYEMPDLAMGLIKILIEKLRFTTEYAESIVQYDTAGRLLNMLLQYNKMIGVEIEAGVQYELNLSMHQEDMATMVGARREWVNRILRKWKKNGLIDYRKGKITILDLPALEKERDQHMEIFDDDEIW